MPRPRPGQTRRSRDARPRAPARPRPRIISGFMFLSFSATKSRLFKGVTRFSVLNWNLAQKLNHILSEVSRAFYRIRAVRPRSLRRACRERIAAGLCPPQGRDCGLTTEECQSARRAINRNTKDAACSMSNWGNRFLNEGPENLRCQPNLAGLEPDKITSRKLVRFDPLETPRVDEGPEHFESVERKAFAARLVRVKERYRKARAKTMQGCREPAQPRLNRHSSAWH